MNGNNINTEVVKHTVVPVSSGHNFIFNTFAAIDSTSFLVSSDATAAKTSTPFPIDEIRWLSTVTEADATRCRTAVKLSATYNIRNEHVYYPSWRNLAIRSGKIDTDPSAEGTRRFYLI